MKSITVFFIAAEAAPYVKVGGLGDVAGSLPPALLKIPPGQIGNTSLDVRLVLPYHPVISIPASKLKYLGQFRVPSSPRKGVYAKVYATENKGVPVYLISGKPIAANPSVYSRTTWEDGDKYVFFSRAALLLPAFLHQPVDLFHCNDWHTALINYLLQSQKSSNPWLKTCASILTIHNLPFMGGGVDASLSKFSVEPASDPSLPAWSRSFPLPMGISKADRIIAVSPTYAQELLTPEFGCGLQGYLESRKPDLSGILNGIDLDEWNPASDHAIDSNYTSATLDKRSGNKASLVSEFNLDPDPHIPLISMVSRLDPQKGVDLIPAALRSIQAQPWQAVLLGSGNPDIQEQLMTLAQELPARVKVFSKFDLALSHRIYAGSDLLLMPSRYEPCGLSQMIAMRYGCLPVARATGGLVDTIDAPSQSQPGTGFIYQGGEAIHLAEALTRALTVYQTNQTQWKEMQRSAMQRDFSWDNSAKKYAEIYKQVVSAQET
jgi:starch synthase